MVWRTSVLRCTDSRYNVITVQLKEGWNMAGLIEFLSGNLLPVIFMLIGFGLLILEIYLPGFGLPGISGTILLIVGVVMISETVLQGLLIMLIAVVLLCAAFSIAIRKASKGKFIDNRLVLESVATQANEDNPLDFYMEKEGVAATRLNPVGNGDFDGVRLSVLSEGPFIDAGEKIRVVKVEGKKLYVRKL